MSFPLMGNSGVQNALTAAIKADRLPHAVLIEGDKGTGRHTLAKFIACAAVCGGEDKPCGECREHTRIFTRPPPRTAKRI